MSWARQLDDIRGETAGPIGSAVRNQRAISALFLLSVQPSTPAHWTMPLTCCSSVKPFQAHPHRCVSSGVSMAILKPVTLTVKMGSSIPTREVLPSGRLKTRAANPFVLTGFQRDLGNVQEMGLRRDPSLRHKAHDPVKISERDRSQQV